MRGEEIILIGHSMGTIIANNILARFQELDFRTIVYMAAACTIKDVELVIPPYMQKNPDTTFYSLKLSYNLLIAIIQYRPTQLIIVSLNNYRDNPDSRYLQQEKAHRNAPGSDACVGDISLHRSRNRDAQYTDYPRS